MSPRMLQWSVFLSAYNYPLFYYLSKGLGHPAEDLLPAHGAMQLEEVPQHPLHASDISAHSTKDPTLIKVLNWL